MSTTDTAGLTIRTTSGSVRGFLEDGAHSFLGIPYAAPPVGPRRFGAPERPEPWDGVRDALEFGATAPQAESVGPMFPQVLVDGDDYLNLNVFTPDPGATGLPVLFMIHGGGFVFGSNIHPSSGTARFAARGMVIVSINYRLGFEGFLSLRDAPPNRAVMDWLRALEWVQENIAAFGGDPGQVTICGYSSGSAACCQLLALPQARDLFHRAIPMSGTAWNQVSYPEAEAWAETVAAELGVERTTEGFGAIPEADLIRAQDRLAPTVEFNPDAIATFRQGAAGPGTPGPRPGRGCLGPAVDGDIVPDFADAAIAAGAGGDRGLLIGCTANEMDALIGVFGSGIERTQAETELRALGIDDAAVSRWFDAHVDRTPGDVLGAALTALTFRLPLLNTAEAHARAGGPTHVYHFTWQPPTPLRAVHCIDLPFAFGGTDEAWVDMLCGGEPPRTLADDYSGAITNFVINGDPGWGTYTDSSRVVKAFDLPSHVGTSGHDDLVRDVFGALRGVDRRPVTATDRR